MTCLKKSGRIPHFILQTVHNITVQENILIKGLELQYNGMFQGSVFRQATGAPWELLGLIVAVAAFKNFHG